MADEDALADRRLFLINDEQAEAFDALLNRPPVFKPQLAALLARAEALGATEGDGEGENGGRGGRGAERGCMGDSGGNE